MPIGVLPPIAANVSSVPGCVPRGIESSPLPMLILRGGACGVACALGGGMPGMVCMRGVDVCVPGMVCIPGAAVPGILGAGVPGAVGMVCMGGVEPVGIPGCPAACAPAAVGSSAMARVAASAACMGVCLKVNCFFLVSMFSFACASRSGLCLGTCPKSQCAADAPLCPRGLIRKSPP